MRGINGQGASADERVPLCGLVECRRHPGARTQPKGSWSKGQMTTVRTWAARLTLHELAEHINAHAASVAHNKSVNHGDREVITDGRVERLRVTLLPFN